MKKNKQIKRIVVFFSIISLINCKSETKSDIKGNTTIKENRIIGLNNSLSKIIIDYLKENPKKIHSNGYSEESYYVGFLPIKKDTLLAIFKQPFLMDKIFPERAYRTPANATTLKHYLSKIKIVGVTSYLNNDIIIFDAKESGLFFYSKAKLKKEIPETISYKTPDKDEIWHPKQYAIWKYKIVNKELIFIEKKK